MYPAESCTVFVKNYGGTPENIKFPQSCMIFVVLRLLSTFWPGPFRPFFPFPGFLSLLVSKECVRKGPFNSDVGRSEPINNQAIECRNGIVNSP